MADDTELLDTASTLDSLSLKTRPIPELLLLHLDPLPGLGVVEALGPVAD